MTLSDAQIETLQAADFTAREAKALYDNARLVREREIRLVAAEGGTYREIARVAGVAYQRVAQIVTGHEPPQREWNDFLAHDCPKCGVEAGSKCEGTSSYAHHERHMTALRAFQEKHPDLG